MANTLVPQDVYALMNKIVSEATGRTDISVTDTSSFVSVGETLLRVSTENTLNAISTVLAKTIFSVRPYTSSLNILNVSNERWGAVTRKIVTLYDEAEASSDYNTNINPNQLDDGQSIDPWIIRRPKVLQLNMYGTLKLQKHITVFRDQLSLAFTSEAEFVRFINAIMVEFNNEISLLVEAKQRGVLISAIAGMHAMGLKEIDLVNEFNKDNGTSYLRADVLSTYLTEFMQFVASTIKIYSDKLKDMSVNYHANLSNYPAIMRHTPKEMQRMVMYSPIFTKMKTTVFSEIFNPSYLEIGDFEGVNYWQSNKEGNETKIKCRPNILNVNTGESQTASEDVELDYVLGLLYDIEFMGTNTQFDWTATSALNVRGGYTNTFVHFRFNNYVDYSENAILFVLGEGGEPV